jgi:trehalose-6-phosphate synthase
MHILSYRGLPDDETGRVKVAGGNVSVSASLFRLVQSSGANWFNWVGNDLRVTAADGRSRILDSFSPETIERHYRCSNGLFWPLLHLYPEFVQYDQNDLDAYWSIQNAAAKTVIANCGGQPVNVHDYQLFGVPALLKEAGVRSTFFLHLPFPKEVADQYVWALQYAVSGMLGAEVIGLHIPSYRRNLLAFVRKHLANEFKVKGNSIIRLDDGTVTRVVVSPIGTNKQLWSAMADNEVQLPPDLSGKKLFMLIGRSDPAKGIPNCIRAWGMFQQHYPAAAADSVLLVISSPSREQVDCFKTERLIIERSAELVRDFVPGSLVFRNVGLPAHELASYYRQASVLLACSKHDREGWGLTAPEFAACQDARRGAVIGMSKGVGAYSVFGDFVTELDPENPLQMAARFADLRNSIGSQTSIYRMGQMQARIPTMDGWWKDMQLTSPRASAA